MKRLTLGIQRFDGGTATDNKIGIPHSFAYSQALDFRKKPSQLSVLPGATKVSSGNVVDLMQHIIQVPNGTRYGLGSNGKFYKITTSNVFSVIGDVGAGAFGLVYRADTDSIYITSPTAASRYYPVSGSNPSLEVNKYAQSKSVDPSNIRTGGLLTYNVLTAINEAAANRCLFTPDIEPLYSIKVWVTAKGTGDWTATIHDDANNVLGTSTVTNANLTNSQLNEFVFTTPLRMLVKPNARTYHIHITSTVADGTAQVTTASDFSTADFEIWASRFVTPNNGMHPVSLFQQFVCIGNERYLTAWEPLEDTPSNAQWLRHRLTFPPGYEVCGLSFSDEFLAIACEKRSTSATKEFQDGKIFFWDGGATTYNFFVDVPEGSPYSLTCYENIFYYIAGDALWANGGSKQSTKIRTFKGSDSEYSGIADYTVNYPNAMAVRRGTLLMAYPSETSNTSVEHGVYSYGSIEKNYPKSFGYSYVISPGTKLNTGSNNLRIGGVWNFGDTMYISWRDDDNGGYGVDVVNNSTSPASTFSWESLIWDGGQVHKQKDALRMKISFEDLPSGVTITPKYKMDRGAWVTGDVCSSGTECYLNFSTQKRFREIQFGFDGTCTSAVTTPPVIISVALEVDPLSSEMDL